MAITMVILKRVNVISGGYITYEPLFCHRLDMQPAEISSFSQFIKRFTIRAKCKILNIINQRENRTQTEISFVSMGDLFFSI